MFLLRYFIEAVLRHEHTFKTYYFFIYLLPSLMKAPAKKFTAKIVCQNVV